MNQPTGKYEVRLLNMKGQLIMAKRICHKDINEPINCNVTLAHGVYHLEVTSPSGEVKTIKVLN